MRAWMIAIAGLVVACGGRKDGATPPAPRASRLQVVYDIDLAKAVDDRLRVVRRELEDQLGDRGLAAILTVTFDGLTITPGDPTARAAIEGLITATYGADVVPRPCPSSAAAASLCLGLAAGLAHAVEQAALAAAIETIRARVATIAKGEASVVARDDQIVVELPGDDGNLAAMKPLLVRTGQLELKGVDDGAAFMRALAARAGDDPDAAAAGITVDADAWADEAGTQHVDAYLIAADRAVLERYLGSLTRLDPSFAIPDDRAIGYGRLDPAPPGAPPRWRTYYLERTAALTGRAIQRAEVTRDGTDRASVDVTFNRDGSRALAELTTRLVGHKLAVILDDTVTTAPIITGPIVGGRASITMAAGTPEDEARDATELVLVLRTGALPAPLAEVSSTVVP